ncbi:serine hydrolase domain-containing protein [Lactococcus nasutitermitis]|uniref:Serine hydrolase domain-containing protein n=1 Tax=Lactococcus nasutitermitis TaxID=1652957 RepID=A0ABV9JAT3_9LACT|nr:serine hydrolase domain-containing protein [Lactococcus nasutitermitis]
MRNEQQILEMINDYQENEIFPAANFAVLENDNVNEFISGFSSILPEKKLLQPDMHWDLASVTKVVGTGTVVIDMILAGELELDAPLIKYYPAFSHSSISLRQLLTHTSGINPFILNRDELSADELKIAINHISVTDDKTFLYTDINFILLGFMLEEIFDQSLNEIFLSKVFEKWQMNETMYGPVENAVPANLTIPAGTVHDPKARVLGVHCGSAGLFSTLTDLSKFVKGYFSDEKYLQLVKNFAQGKKQRSLAWDLVGEQKDWLLHTGYTGTFILMNLQTKKAVIFLSNRVYFKDERAKWIIQRDKLIQKFIENLTDN